MTENTSNLHHPLFSIAGKSPDLLMHTMEASPDNISVADATKPDMPLIYVNPAFHSTTGYGREEIIGKNCRFLQGEDTNPDHVSALRRAIAERRPIEIELLNYRKSGEPFMNFLKMSPIFDAAGDLISFLGIQRDVTQQKLLAERDIGQNRLEALGQAAGSVAHQLNNLLHPVISMIDLHKDDMSDPQARADLDMALYSARQAADMSEYLLGMSRGKMLRETATTNISASLAKATKLAKLMLPPTVKIEESSSDLPEHLETQINETLFAQVIINIVNNAAQATKQRGTIRIESRTLGNGFAEISISDNGPGIPLALREKVFQPFYSTKLSKRGSGLGLSVVLQIINERGGNIRIENGLERPEKSGFGCKFSISIPYLA